MNISENIEFDKLRAKLSDFVAKMIPSDIGEVWLFGSRARGDFNSYSDWDILILLNTITSEDNDFEKYIYPIIEFGWKNDMELNPIIYSRQGWENHPMNLFHYNVQKDKIRL